MSYEPGDFADIQTPPVVFTGEYDPYVQPEHSAALSEVLPLSEFSLLKDCDHLFHIENPKETITLIREFLLKETIVLWA